MTINQSIALTLSKQSISSLDIIWPLKLEWLQKEIKLFGIYKKHHILLGIHIGIPYKSYGQTKVWQRNDECMSYIGPRLSEVADEVTDRTIKNGWCL